MADLALDDLIKEDRDKRKAQKGSARKVVKTTGPRGRAQQLNKNKKHVRPRG